MSIEAIQRYHRKVEKIIRYGGSHNESALRFAFQSLLASYCAPTGLALIAELEYKTRAGTTVRPDGTLKDALRQDWGYWESKEQHDDLDTEIVNKLAKGYPQTNILFEDSQTAVLLQDGLEVARVSVTDASALHTLLTSFISYEPPRVQTFRAAIATFKADLPDLLVTLRGLIAAQAQSNAAFFQARAAFLDLCQKAINPQLVLADVREMLIQHLLTADIFITIFDDAQFHRENNMARELYRVSDTFYTGDIRRNIERRVAGYVKVIKAAAAEIANHHEKQRFLKAVYENFYTAYNPAGADRLGIVYTPHEIVRFMLAAADHLVYQHFGRFLADKDVDILDPATGTGTFITELLEYLPRHSLPYKYAHEIHCNEVALLPYYIANLNIEYTYAQKMGTYKSFDNICFVDTLDNLSFAYDDQQYAMFDFSAENFTRIKQQNTRKISVIMGNPPYNANQRNENENNKNRAYPRIDARIKETYIKHSTAQKTKLYDMYTRFIRWASERIGEEGVIAFVTNNSFIDARTYDGFRKVVAEEFSAIYIVDLKGNSRVSGQRAQREGGNVFGVRVGIAVWFFVRQTDMSRCKIYYTSVADFLNTAEKLAFLNESRWLELPFKHIQPTLRHTWINQTEHEWDDLLPMETKSFEPAILKFSSLGVSTNRDEWVFDHSQVCLKQKVMFFLERYNAQVTTIKPSDKLKISDVLDYTIKWSATLKQNLLRQARFNFAAHLVINVLRRPFVCLFYYAEKGLSDRLTANHYAMFGQDLTQDNVIITVNVGNKPFNVLASKYLVDLHFNGDAQCFPRYTYDAHGTRHDNVTAWAVAQFTAHYGFTETTWPVINTSIHNSQFAIRNSKDALFAYIYAVLHHPAYREKYKLNLKREFPHIPLYNDFAQWAVWGQQLLDLHLHYESATPYPLRRVDLAYDPERLPQPKLRANPAAGEIVLDTATTLSGIPATAWEYRLGNRTAIEWVLEYHKERKPRDPTIREKFNTYRLTDYKEPVIELLQRVVTVSVETVNIVNQMRAFDEAG